MIKKQHKETISAIRESSFFLRPNERAATALVPEENLGLCGLAASSNYAPAALQRTVNATIGQITGKRRVFAVPLVVKQQLSSQRHWRKRLVIFHCRENHVKAAYACLRLLGVCGSRNAQLLQVVRNGNLQSNGYDIALVKKLLQHSSSTATQRCIGIEPQAILNNASLM